ncbi:short-chain fatty acyl-CoA regulator family protein [Aestuariibius sp. 2305UL40-4]|uniref:short-chain fatty acyl-CoA regulator family protein n=1 Tax=Aestuariibius violaceus TaxID=3234132 RepID=UPI00345E9D14
MVQTAVHVGSRIRERRIALGVQQAELARQVEISPSYLNLIEHNRRRIGGKLLARIARNLDVDPRTLSAAADVALIEEVRAAAAGLADGGGAAPEFDRAAEMTARFPGWATLLARQAREIDTLTDQVEALGDRMAHDPDLAAALHDVISAVTAIRSTSSILVNGGDLDADWRQRFHANLYNDSVRLAESSQSLVDYLDTSAGEAAGRLPTDEVLAFFDAQGWFIDTLETGGTGAVDDLCARHFPVAIRKSARPILMRYAVDAEALSLDRLADAVSVCGPDPGAIAACTGAPIGCVLRRLAVGTTGLKGRPAGLILCDPAGAILFRKPIAGFSVPRLGAACPLWPVFTALGRVGQPVRGELAMPDVPPSRFSAYAIAEIRGTPSFDDPPVIEATMLLLGDAPERPDALEVGSSCRVCPRKGCPARREAALL